MNTESMQEIIDMMLSKKVAAFRVDLKNETLEVTFSSAALIDDRDMQAESMRKKSMQEEIDEALGFEWEE